MNSFSQSKLKEFFLGKLFFIIIILSYIGLIKVITKWTSQYQLILGFFIKCFL